MKGQILNVGSLEADIMNSKDTNVLIVCKKKQSMPLWALLFELFVLGYAMMAALLKVVFPFVLGATLLFPMGGVIFENLDVMHAILAFFFICFIVASGVNSVVAVFSRFQNDFLEDPASFDFFLVMHMIAVHWEGMIFGGYVNLGYRERESLLDNAFSVLLVIEIILYIMSLIIAFNLSILRNREERKQDFNVIEV